MQRFFQLIMSALPVAIIALTATLLAFAGDTSVPAKPKALAPNELGVADSLDVFVDELTIHLLLGDNGAEGKAPVFRHSKSIDGGVTWSEPVRVNTGDTAPVKHHRGADAQIVARGDKLFAAWTTPGTGFKGTGPMGTAISSDGGATWTAGPNPADHDSTGSHRFLALAADDAAFHLVWLDDRDEKRGLRHASSTDGGKTWSRNSTLDDFTCACCWNDIVYLPHNKPNSGTKKSGTLYVLYRDMNPSDMGLSRSIDGGKTWKNLGHVGDYAWEFKGCPHVGGELALSTGTGGSETLFAAVWTGLPGRVGCYLLSSDNGGEGWMPARRLGADMARHPALCAREKRIVAGWDEAVGDERATFFQGSVDGGKTWAAPVRLSTTGMQASHVRIIPACDGFLALWTESTGNASAKLVMKSLSNKP